MNARYTGVASGAEEGSTDTMSEDGQTPPVHDGGSAFDRLLASPRYERLRAGLVRMFARRGCESPEELADETVSRVIAKLPAVAPDFVGDPVRYVYAVARNVLREHSRRPKPAPMPPDLDVESPSPDARVEARDRCLDVCLGKLSSEERELVRAYYLHDRNEKIDHRRSLARRLGLGQNALRIKIFRLRQRLAECMRGCLDPRFRQ